MRSTALFSRGGESDYNLVLIDGVRVNLRRRRVRLQPYRCRRNRTSRGRARCAVCAVRDPTPWAPSCRSYQAGRSDGRAARDRLGRGRLVQHRSEATSGRRAERSERIDYSVGVTRRRRTDGRSSNRFPRTTDFDQTAFDASGGDARTARIVPHGRALQRCARAASVGQITYGIRNTGGTAETKDFNWYLNLNHTAGSRYTGTATVNYFRCQQPVGGLPERMPR